MTRRDALRGLGAGVAGLALAGGGQQRAAMASPAPATGEWRTPPVRLAIGQTEAQVYVGATGHTVSGIFLDYWRANGAASVYGNPISEPFVSSDGYESQAFETAIFQFRPEFLETVEPIVRLMPLGWAARERFGAASASAPGAATRASIAEQGGVVDEETGHTISGDFLAWYRFNEGRYYLGRPLSEPMPKGDALIQIFQGGALRRGASGVSLAPVANDLASHFGIDTGPVDQGDLPSFDERFFWIADPPELRADPYSPGAKWLEVGIGEQQLWAYQGQTVIASSLISTGIAPNDTDLGMFRVRLKYPAQDMEGFTDETGEVLGFGAAPDGTVPYEVANVPHVMYFNLDAEALHGAYWHHNFGQRMSHGCVNLPLDFAAWLYGWAPLGTGVWVRE
jgi:lipoprotein-anchoring transpeptidase ErfK/SrfK